MKFLLRWTTVVTLAVVALVAGGYIAMRYALSREVVDHSKDGLNYLRAAIHAYAKDSLELKRSPIYPQQLHDLLKENYLNQGDIQDCTHGMKVDYWPPPEGSPDSFVLLKGSAEDFVLFCPLSGRISEAKTKKL